MATTLKTKNSVTTTVAPTTLQQGELAVNITDKKMWVGNAATTPIQLLGDGGSVNFTTVDTTNLQVTNIKAKDGTASATIANSTGIFTHSTATIFTAGTVSLPAITTTGDTNTGIFFPAADTIAFTEGGTEAMRITSTGIVGIGTSSPAGSLQVKATTNISLYVGNSGSGSIEVGNYDVTDGYNPVLIDGSYVAFATGTAGGQSVTERMRIDSSGQLLVGTTTALAQTTIYKAGSGLQVSSPQLTLQNAVVDGGSGDGAGINFANATGAVANLGSTGDGQFFFSGRATSGSSWATRMRIDSSGIVTMSAYGAGAATFSATGVISSVSDETWKTKDGVPVNPDKMLQKLEPGYWFYNDEKAPIFGKDRQLGFYAQNVHEAIGNEAAPTPEEGKPWGYYDRSVLAVAVMSLKNALSTIEELKQRIEILENK
jgi:hypothetical protein